MAVVQEIRTSPTNQELQNNVTIYCGPGQWHRMAYSYFNMSDPSQQCPSTWRAGSTYTTLVESELVEDLIPMKEVVQLHFTLLAMTIVEHVEEILDTNSVPQMAWLCNDC